MHYSSSKSCLLTFNKSFILGTANPFDRRWILAYISCLGFVLVNATRVNISVAIICMVRTAVTISNNTEVSNGTTETSIVDEACDVLEQATSSLQRGEFDRDKVTQSRVLAMYFYGYIFTQIPGGWLAGRYGARKVWGLAMFVNGLGTLLTPVSARVHLYLLYAVRFIIGFAAGVSYPVTHSMWGRWAPPLERSKLMSLCYSGPNVGTIVAFSVSGYLCVNGFDNGWGSIFYIIGSTNIVWVGLWAVLSADSPRKHRFITQREVKYIESKITYNTSVKTRSTPWMAMAKSGPLWAIIICQMCHDWTSNTLMTVLPTFMKEVLKYDILQNGALSSLPYVCGAVFCVVAGQLADHVRSTTKLGTTRVRQIWQSTSLLSVAAFLIVAGFVSCERRWIAIVLLCAASGSMSFCTGGYLVSHVDIAPRYAGILFGITNTIGTTTGMIAPLVAGALTPNKSAEEWRNVLYICAALCVAGALVYTLLISGETQPWNDYDDVSLELAEHEQEHTYLAVGNKETQPK